MIRTSSIATICFFFVFTLQSLYAQDKLNNYQYLLIPEQLSFQDTPNEYNVNQLLKSELSKRNFRVYISGDTIPKKIKPCEILRLNATKSGFLSTKMSLSFSDCYGINIYTSTEGKSKIKQFKPAIYEALKKATNDINIVEHQYNAAAGTTEIPKKSTEVLKDIFKNATVLEFQGNQYYFVKRNDSYDVYLDKDKIGRITKINGPHNYKIDTKKISGYGDFDEFGNFYLYRKNPLNQKTIKDTMLRID
ncbi:hypothetical protein ACXGQW_10805 [Wenyingzhuangia sp. IMCC45533]